MRYGVWVRCEMVAIKADFFGVERWFCLFLASGCDSARKRGWRVVRRVCWYLGIVGPSGRVVNCLD